MLDESIRERHPGAPRARTIRSAPSPGRSNVSRDTVQAGAGRGQRRRFPELPRPEKAEEHQEEILELLPACKGNLIRVHEKLRGPRGGELSYQALTGFCRRHGIGHERPHAVRGVPFRAGRGDAARHQPASGADRRAKLMLIQDASLVLCHSRMLFHQYYPTFNRFWCKVFLTEALDFFGGACALLHDRQHPRGGVLQGTGASP